jgi:hypothetical protein
MGRAGKIVEDDNLVTVGDEQVDDMRTDQAGSAGNKGFHVDLRSNDGLGWIVEKGGVMV